MSTPLHEPLSSNNGESWFSAARRKTAATVAGALMTAATVAGCMPSTAAGESEPKRQEQATESVAPDPEASETETQETKLQPFYAAEYTTGEELARAWIDNVYSTWMNTGADESYVDGYLEHNATNWRTSPEAAADSYSSEQYSEDVASAMDEEVLNTYFIKDWQSVETLATEVGQLKDIHARTLWTYGMTSQEISYDEADVEPYDSWGTVTSVEMITDEPEMKVMVVTYDRHDNANMNRAAELNETTYDEPVSLSTRFTWVVEDGQWKIADSVPN